MTTLAFRLTDTDIKTRAALLLFVAALVLPFGVEAQILSASSDRTQSSSTNLTVYNSGRALVTEQRSIELPQGTVALKYMDVAQRIMPETVSIRSTSAGPGFDILEQNFEYDLLSPKKMLEKYIGKNVNLIFTRSENNSTLEEQKSATLLSTNDGTVWQVDNQILVNPNYTRLSFPELPKNLYSKPTLVWLLNSKAAGKRTVQASYLSEGISWKADYVLSIANDEKQADLMGWVTINNNSGNSYDNARLQLIAGDVNQVQEQSFDQSLMERRTLAVEMGKGSQFAEKEFFEYHLYTLERPSTVANNQQKQILLLEGAEIGVEKVFRLKGQPWYYTQGYSSDKQKVEVALRIKNSKENKLGMPFPKGIVRVYKRDTDGSQQFIGEDRIDHTAKNEILDLTIGNAFDIVAERKQSDFKDLSKGLYESAYEITFRNQKESAVSVIVTEPIGGDWEMLSNSHKYTKSSAFAAEFVVPIEAGKEVKLSYRVRVRHHY